MRKDCIPSKKSVIPKFCYSKGFYILLGFIVTTSSTFVFGMQAQYSELDDRVRATEVQIAENNVPELKHYIANEFYELNEKVDHNTELLQDNYRLLCKLAEGNC